MILSKKSRISTGTRILSTYIVFEFVQLCSKDLHWKVKSSVQHSVDRYYVYVYYVYSVSQKLWFLCVKTIKPMSTVLAKSCVWLNGTETPLQEEADIYDEAHWTQSPIPAHSPHSVAQVTSCCQRYGIQSGTNPSTSDWQRSHHMSSWFQTLLSDPCKQTIFIKYMTNKQKLFIKQESDPVNQHYLHIPLILFTWNFAHIGHSFLLKSKWSSTKEMYITWI